MTTSKRRNKRAKGGPPCLKCADAGSPRQAHPAHGVRPGEPFGHDALFARGIMDGDACERLRRIKKEETDDLIRRRRAHTDDLIRVFRNLAALAAFSIGALALVTFAGIRMGVPPEFCLAGGLSGATLLVRAFIKIFDSVRPALPDAPEDPPSTCVP